MRLKSFSEFVNEQQLKISKAVWNKFTQNEKDYIQDVLKRSRFGVDLLEIKRFFKDARERFKNNYVLCFHGVVEHDNKRYKYSGTDTRRFIEVNN